jgi:hypothetical protein
MPAAAPQSRYGSFPATGVLFESTSPPLVGGSGLTAVDNLVYKRQGAWGKRTGVHRDVLPSGGKLTPVSGYRWYRAFPTPVTNLVVYARNHLYIGNGPLSLADLGSFDLSVPGNAPSFCTMRDPQAANGNGADILIICGIELAGGSPANGEIIITGAPGTAPGGTTKMSITVQNGAEPEITTSDYIILGSDNASSIAQQLVTLLNQTQAYINNNNPYPPFLGESYITAPNPVQSSGNPPVPKAVIHMGAAIGGGAGNNITYTITFTAGTDPGSTLAVSPASGTPTNMTGGGVSWHGPCRYDLGLNRVIALSYMAPNAFTGCCTWHNHAWFWGDPNNPDTAFACDIDQPEAFTFMIQNGGMDASGSNDGTNGGYSAGPGDGDPGVQTCIPLGNALYLFKTNNIYMIEGYDFQQGEYQFSLTPQIVGYGMPSPYCGAVLENEIVWWSGKKFLRLATGSYVPEHIGMPIKYTEGLASKGDQQVVRCVAGDLQVLTLLNQKFGLDSGSVDETIMYNSIALWAMDLGTGNPDTIVVYDDDATTAIGQYAWSRWTGWEVGCWIQYGVGPTPSGMNTDPPIVWFVNSHGSYIHLVGGNAADDWTNPIPWMVQTGYVAFDTPEVLKNCHRFMVNAEANAGANFTAQISPGRIIPNSGQILPYSTAVVTLTFNPTLAPQNGEAYNELEKYFEPAMQAKSVIVQLAEDGTSMVDFEVLSWGFDINPQEAFAP